MLFGSCEKTESIVDFPMVPSKLVVNCEMNEDSAWRLQLSKSLSVLDNAPIKFIDTAIVKVYEEGLLLETLSSTAYDGIYLGTSKPKPNLSYRISVTGVKSYDSIFAEDVLPDKAYIDNVDIAIIDSSFYNDGYYSYGFMEVDFMITINDDVSQQDFYGIRAYTIDTFYTGSDSSYYDIYRNYMSLNSSDPIIDDNSDWNQPMFKDNIFNGQSIELVFNSSFYNYEPSINVYLELMTFSKAAYLYKTSYNNYVNVRNNPFAEPVQVYSNVTNGYGILSGTSVTSYAFTF